MSGFWIFAAIVVVLYLLSKIGTRNATSPPPDTSRVGLPHQSSIRPTSSIPKPKAAQSRQIDVADVEFNPEFQTALNLIDRQGKSIFITGKAGTGKSTLLRYFRAITEKSVVVLAPTGVAAVNVGGQTIHSFFGFPPHLIVPVNIQPSRNPELFRKIDTLVIDEVSMVRADLMDGIDVALRLNRDCPDTPFGGVQLVLIGDLFQLRPIVKERNLQEFFTRYYGGPYFFKAKAFQETDFNVLELQKVYRQKDATFVALLNAIREGRLDGDTFHTLNSRVRERNAFDDLEAYVTLVPTNQAAFDINIEHLAKLPVPEYTFDAIVTGDFDKSAYPTESTLRLKVGARIMMLRNDPEKRWVNGTLGSVSHLSQTRLCVDIDGISYDVPRYRWENVKHVFDRQDNAITQEVVGTFEQYPVRLSWALTINKSQGQTFDRVYLDLGAGAFTHGQTYVALSRCRTLDGLALRRPVLSSDVIFDETIYGYRDVFSPVVHEPS